jgi:hypothetical protein
MFVLFVSWIVLAFGGYILFTSGPDLGMPVPEYFPISIFYGPRIHFSGLPYTVLFVIVLFLSARHIPNFNVLQVWGLGLTLIVLGNLAQGSIDAAFCRPFCESGFQYYHDAIQVSDWREWLREFNVNQSTLLRHSKTHPPFAVLLHYSVLNSAGHSVLVLAGSFTVLSSLSIILVWKIMRSIGLTVQQSSHLALLFSVIPAFNIYSAVCLDGVTAMFCTLSLLGLVRILRDGASPAAVSLFTAGALFTNLLTFGGIFLFAVACLMMMREIIIRKKYDVLRALLVGLLVIVITYGVMLHCLGYDHIKAFHTASWLENPSGFRTLQTSIDYVLTRIEGLAEIALFLSIGVLAVLFRNDYLGLRICDLHSDATSIFLAGITTLLLMFLTGAFRTGETARICLFVYPYFVIVLRKLHQPILRSLSITAGLQTIAMQTLGGYFW